MCAVIFPEVLARVAGLPSTRLSSQGGTARERVEHLCEGYAELRRHLFHDNQRFKDHFLLTANGQLVDDCEPLAMDAELEILLATSGGLDLEELSSDEIRRYVQHITLPNVGRQGQLLLKKARVLIVGAGGLGSPVSLYLAAAGVGTLGLVDFDRVERSNLQRQVVHGSASVGMAKVESARCRLLDLNPDIEVNTYGTSLNADNALGLIGDYDLVVDGSDNFATRYLVNDACVLLGRPLVYGALHRFDGQASVFNHRDGACYRCLFPAPPPAELSPNCNAGGVIGVLPGVIGLIQATETVKLLLCIGQSLSGRLLRFDALAMTFSEVGYRRRADCPTCSPSRTDRVLQELAVEFCTSATEPSRRLPDDFFVTPVQLQQYLERSGEVRLLDVREPNEQEVCQLPGSVNIPSGDIRKRLGELDRQYPWCVICYAGTRAEQAAITLMDEGFTAVRVLQGGIKAWARDVEPDMPMY